MYCFIEVVSYVGNTLVILFHRCCNAILYYLRRLDSKQKLHVTRQ